MPQRFSPLNVAFVDGLPVSAFDFDQAAPGPRARDLAHAAWLWLLGAGIVRPLDHELALLRTFLDVYGFEDEARRGFGGRIVARSRQSATCMTVPDASPAPAPTPSTGASAAVSDG
ncbi:hypothetical protein ABZV75_27335 [Streptomyces flaveolus]|uniref:hypothetical protein n=1 Tax=Streptomyces flaveolus TaxID=67297 RepID=UPI0033AEC349